MLIIQCCRVSVFRWILLERKTYEERDIYLTTKKHDQRIGGRLGILVTFAEFRRWQLSPSECLENSLCDEPTYFSTTWTLLQFSDFRMPTKLETLEALFAWIVRAIQVSKAFGNSLSIGRERSIRTPRELNYVDSRHRDHVENIVRCHVVMIYHYPYA